jgi:hypothetical protein
MMGMRRFLVDRNQNPPAKLRFPRAITAERVVAQRWIPIPQIEGESAGMSAGWRRAAHML